MLQGPHQKKAIFVFQLVFAIGLLAVLWRIVEGEEALRLLARAEPWWLVASFVALTLQTALSAQRWRLTAGQLGIVLTKAEAIKEYYLAQIVNQAVPGGIVGDAGRAVRARTQAGLMASSQAVLLERVAGQVALVAVMFVGLGVALILPGGLSLLSGLALVVGLLGVGAVVGVVSVFTLARRSAGRLGNGLVSLGTAAKAAFFPPSVRCAQIGLSLATAMCNVAGFTFAAWAIDSDLTVSTALALVPLILLAMVVPLTISGWGVREGAAVALFPLGGIAAVEGLAASVAFGLVFLAAALPGLAFAGKRRRQAPRENEESASSL
jgi:uncharacterized membrane protein YbhN (UPF0104 family)